MCCSLDPSNLSYWRARGPPCPQRAAPVWDPLGDLPGSCSSPTGDAGDAPHLEAPALKVQLQLHGSTVLGKVWVGWEHLEMKDGAVSQGSGLTATTPRCHWAFLGLEGELALLWSRFKKQEESDNPPSAGCGAHKSEWL